MRTKLARMMTEIPPTAARLRRPAVIQARRGPCDTLCRRFASVFERSSMRLHGLARATLVLLGLVLVLTLTTAGTLFATPAPEKTPAPAASSRDKDKDKEKPKTLSDQFEGLSFRTIGPYRGGRSIAVAGVRHQPNVFYF